MLKWYPSWIVQTQLKQMSSRKRLTIETPEEDSNFTTSKNSLSISSIKMNLYIGHQSFNCWLLRFRFGHLSVLPCRLTAWSMPYIHGSHWKVCSVEIRLEMKKKYSYAYYRWVPQVNVGRKAPSSARLLSVAVWWCSQWLKTELGSWLGELVVAAVAVSVGSRAMEVELR